MAAEEYLRCSLMEQTILVNGMMVLDWSGIARTRIAGGQDANVVVRLQQSKESVQEGKPGRILVYDCTNMRA